MRSLLLVLAAVVAASCTLDRAGLIEDSGTGGAAQGGSPATGGQPATTTSTAQGGGVTTTSTGGGLPEIDCLDGVDNDQDGLIDCDDDDCAAGGYVCVPAAGFDTLGFAARVTSADACPATAEALDLTSCKEAACNCTEDGGTCNILFDLFDDSDCNDLIVTRGPDDPCSTGPNGLRWVTAKNPVHNNDASCTPTVQEVGADTLTVCRSQQVGSCDAQPGHVCVPTSNGKPPGCVLVDGSTACGGDYSERRSVVEGAFSTCGCACNPGQTGCQTPVVNTNNGNSCPAPDETTVTAPCTPLGNISAWSVEEQAGTIECIPVVAPSSAATERALCCVPP